MKKSILFLSIGLLVSASGFSQFKKIERKYIDVSNMNLSVKPGDDFFEYANGAWLKTNPIPPSKTRWGSFNILAEESSEALHGLLEDAAANPGKDASMRRVGDYYASAMDSMAIEKLGYQPIKPYLDRIAGISDAKSVLDEIVYLRVNGISSALFNLGVSQDAKRVTQYIPQIGQGGTTLPDRDYYLKDDPRSKNIRAEYLKYLITMFKLCGSDAAAAETKANSILRLETILAGAQMSRVEMRDPNKLYNKFAVDAFSKTTPFINWQELMGKMMINGADSVIVSNPKFIRGIDSLLTAIPVNEWQSYLQWNVMKGAAPFLSSDFVTANFNFTKILSGQKEITPRWQRMSGLIDGNLGDLLGQLYVDKYFNADSKKRMLELVNNLQQTFEARIRRLDWMSEDTKQRAIGKLYAFVKKIGFPDAWKKYEGLEIRRNDFIGNVRRTSQWAYKYNINRLGKPVDKTEWGMTPATVNAYYNPLKNEIAFPAGILRFPFFDFGADDAVNYGGIGAVIGHEMTHGFDDQGRQFDAEGTLKDWWTKDDATEFKKRADQVVEQFNAYTVLDTLHVNGKLTLGENLADLGGLSIAYEAFKKTPQGKSNKKIDGFTPDQRFFLSWAQVWRSNILPETAAQLIITDPHSPGQYRCNGPLTNIDAFYKAFKVKKDNKMYIPEEKRIRVW
jgi:putative endopeptidase